MQRLKILGTFFLLCLPLSAASTDIGEISRVATTLMGELADLGNIVLFITGGSFLISALIKFQQYKRSPQFTPISRPITELLAGVVLIALPFILAVTADNALFNQASTTHPYTRAAP